MESPSRALTLSSSPRRRINDVANSPEFEFEFEFWQNTNSNSGLISTPLHSADELFSDGFLLPLHSLENKRSEPREPDSEPGSSKCSVEPSALITSDVASNGNPILNVSKRWREIFKRSEKKMTCISNSVEENKHEKVDNTREKERKNKRTGSNSAELNINLWPFSRSRSAGNNSSRSNKPVQVNRKVSSAPCSRSNSSGESKLSRKSWPSSPGRPGVHLGRASPVWHVKRGGPGSRAVIGGGTGNGIVSKINNVPVCVRYQPNSGCRKVDNRAVVGGGGKSGGNGTGNGNLFGFRGLFSKKSSTIVTV